MAKAVDTQDKTQREIAEKLEGRTITNVRPRHSFNHGSGQRIVVEFEEESPAIFEMNEPHVWMRLIDNSATRKAEKVESL